LLRRCRDHGAGGKYIQHRTDGKHVCDEHSARRKCARLEDPTATCRYCARACKQHVCEPLANGSIRVMHAILCGAFGRAVRWGWIAVSPMDAVDPPTVPRPNPTPPTAAEAGLILQEAWKDPDWGTLFLLAMTTGRAGASCAGCAGRTLPDCSVQTQPNTVTQRHCRMVRRISLDTHPHELRHYSATELIAAGVDPRTVAGRLGLGGGGSTTLRTYSARIVEADQRAAGALATRRPARPGR
jgi:integrase